MIDWFGWYVVLPLMLLFITVGTIAAIVLGTAAVVETLRKTNNK
jgi:hypothetical protein